MSKPFSPSIPILRVAAWLKRNSWYVGIAIALIVVLAAVAGGPPHQLIIATGPAGGFFDRTARVYAARLKEQGVEAILVKSEGALENLQKLNSAQTQVDIGFVHGGTTDSSASPNLASLGSVAYEPLWIFHRSSLGKLTDLSQLKGLRIALGPRGSGANFLGQRLLSVAGLTSSNASIREADAQSVSALLAAGQVDAVLVMDPPETPYIHDLFMQEGVSVMNMGQADGLKRNLPFLHVLDVPASTVDVARGIPSEPIKVVATTAVVVTRKQTQPALLYLLLSIIDAVHEPPTLLSVENEFPADKDVDLPLSAQAEQYFKDGKPLLQRYLPFWLASPTERMLKFLVPLFAIAFPLFNILPRALQWRVRRKTTQCYMRLMHLEQRVNTEPNAPLLAEFEQLAKLVDRHLKLKSIPASDAYILKEHIDLVKSKMTQKDEPPVK